MLNRIKQALENVEIGSQAQGHSSVSSEHLLISYVTSSLVPVPLQEHYI